MFPSEQMRYLDSLHALPPSNEFYHLYHISKIIANEKRVTYLTRDRSLRY